ncbi:ribosomal-protein-alanine acetyltransferase [Methylovirgula ligni]|uniref:Ribosomal-protein-alanine N-acetyltransferase n=1 Tax=Methylovirgula ligni TaxID=569860 RepID=A0A3D9YR79_9HYPH|nr:GNAT family N-acetyltransferase [Methylovirgula ligni]QAY94986.1 ribosomal-protein-alanine acetyltransferase [Methylovirgula ligni]REF84558.1 ribosomal-protein-alanine N-acetyltransferase [Methylovirgula ligni]
MLRWLGNWLGKSTAPTVHRLGPQFGKVCARIHAQSFPHPWSAEEFEALLAGRDVIAHWANPGASLGSFWQPGRTPVGFILSRRAADQAEILTLAVTPKARQKGVGAALLTTHLPTLAAAGVKSLFLEVEAGNTAAIRLYQNFGFRQVGERKAYYRTAGGSPATALVLRRDLF